MNLFKTVHSKNKTFLIVSIGRKENINYSQVQMLESDKFREYILPFQCTKTTTSNKISFDISGLTSLSEYIKTEINQSQYFKILFDIQKILSFCNKACLSLDNLVCDIKHMYYHNTLNKIQMLYIPVQNHHYICDSISDCLKKLHRHAKNVIRTDENYMNRYEEYLSQFEKSSKKYMTNSFSPDSLLHFFNENKSEVNADTPFIQDNDDFTQSNLNQNSSNINYSTSASKSIHNNNNNYNYNSHSVSNRNFPVSDNKQSASDHDFSVSNNKSCDLNNDFFMSNQTVVVSHKDRVFLADQYNNRYDINKFPFTIGRTNNNDFIINEDTVSSDHATILKINGNYYIEDTKSTNGTFLNDPNNKVKYTQIKNGDVLYFYCYQYVFSVETANKTEETSSGTIMVSRKRPNTFSDNSNNTAYSNNIQVNQDTKAIAYLRKSDGTIIRIMSFPFTDSSLDGIIIYSRNTNNRTAIFIKNNSHNTIIFENSEIRYCETAEIFSGCSLIINGMNYTFYIEN